MKEADRRPGGAVDRLDGTAVVINHDDGPRLGPLLDLLTDEVERIVVVDNASSDGSERQAQDRPRVTLLRNDRNLGFAAAVNQGAGLAQGSWLVLVNPDAHLQPGDIARLVDGLPGDVAAAAPLQVDEHRVAKPESGGYDPTVLRYLLWAVLPVRFHGRFGPWLAKPSGEGDVAMDWVSGALLAIRRDAFERVGRLDDRFFLYHEDVELGRRLRRAGYRVVLRQSQLLYHEVADGEHDRRIRQALLGLDSVAIDFEGWRRPFLGAALTLGFSLRAVAASGTSRTLARAALPSCLRMILGLRPGAGRAGTR